MEKLTEEFVILTLTIVGGIASAVPYIIEKLKSIYTAWSNKKVRNLNKTSYDLKNHKFFTSVDIYLNQNLKRLDIDDRLLKELIYDYERYKLNLIRNICSEIVNLILSGNFDDKSLERTYSEIINVNIDNDKPIEGYPNYVYNTLEKKFSQRNDIIFNAFKTIWFSPVYDSYDERYYAVLDLFDCLLEDRLAFVYKVIINFNGDLNDLEYKGFKKGNYE